MSPPAVACGAALLGTLLTTCACADFSGSVALISDYRFRGVSLSDEKPAAQLGLAYDHPRGWYTGALLSTVQFDNQSRRTQFLPYFGYVQARSGFNWEVGADYYTFTDNHDYDYPEVYFGITSNHLSGRIYYSRKYFGNNSNALYLEINDSRPVIDRLNLICHVGILHPSVASDAASTSKRYLYDLRAGLGIEVHSVNVQLALVVTDSTDASYPVNENQKQNTLVLSLSRPF